MAGKIRSLNARRSLRELAANIKTARRKRRISVQDFAARAGVSTSTIMRLEKGDDGVSIGTLAMAFLVLGELSRISDLLDPGSDDTGLFLENERLPKRIPRSRDYSRLPNSEHQSAPLKFDDELGVGF